MDISAIEGLFNQILEEVSVRMTEAYAQAGIIDRDHPLSQAGLANGTQIVLDYLEHNEAKIALEHLLYMVDEPPLTLSTTTEAAISKLCSFYNIQR